MKLTLCPLTSPRATEPLVAVYLRGDPALSYDEEGGSVLAFNHTDKNGAKATASIRSPAVSKLFQRFNRKPKPAAA